MTSLTRALRDRRADERSKVCRAELTRSERQRVIDSSLGEEPVCIADLLVGRFGRKRFALWLQGNYKDPEMDNMYSELEALAMDEWETLGVDPDVGPYIE